MRGAGQEGRRVFPRLHEGGHLVMGCPHGDPKGNWVDQHTWGVPKGSNSETRYGEAESTLPVAGSTTVFGEATVQRVSDRRRGVKIRMKTRPPRFAPGLCDR